MTSIILSKNTLKKAFGSSPTSNDDYHHSINTGYLERPKTAVPGKRRPLTDKPLRTEDVQIKQDFSEDKHYKSSRPKTAYSNRKISRSYTNLSQTDDNCKLPCDGCAKAKIMSEKDLEDIDIVQYFYDNSIKDIFPSSYGTEFKRMNQKSKRRSPTSDSVKDFNEISKTFSNFEVSDITGLTRRQMQRPLARDTDGYGSEKCTRQTSVLKSKYIPNESGVQTFDSAPLPQWKRKSNSVKEKTGLNLEPRRRLHSDTDVMASTERSAMLGMKSSTVSPTREEKQRDLQLKPTDQDLGSQSSYHLSYRDQRNNLCGKIISKYRNDLRILDTSKFNGQSEKKLNYSLTERPDSLHYNSNKYPRKLKPIPGSDNHKILHKQF